MNLGKLSKKILNFKTPFLKVEFNYKVYVAAETVQLGRFSFLNDWQSGHQLAVFRDEHLLTPICLIQNHSRTEALGL